MIRVSIRRAILPQKPVGGSMGNELLSSRRSELVPQLTSVYRLASILRLLLMFNHELRILMTSYYGFMQYSPILNDVKDVGMEPMRQTLTPHPSDKNVFHKQDGLAPSNWGRIHILCAWMRPWQLFVF